MPDPFEPLARRHDRSGFSCGRAELDAYLRQRAGQDARRGAATCYVADLPDPRTGKARVAAFYTLSAASVLLADMGAVAERLPRYPSVPCVLIGRLAVDRAFGGRGLGAMAVVDAARRSRASGIGAVGLVVDAVEEAVAFYERLGFVRLASASPSPSAGGARRLFVPLATVLRAVDEAP